MRVFAYCCASFAEATRKAAGVEPVLCPPASTQTFDPGWLEGYDLLYFDLHGQPDARHWQGDDAVLALAASQIRQADLGGAVVFALNCYLADEGSPMMDALLDAGARYVIGGDGKNWAGQRDVYGAGLLGYLFRQLLARGVSPLKALALAKGGIRIKMKVDRIAKKTGKVKAARDTLAFKVYYRSRQ